MNRYKNNFYCKFSQLHVQVRTNPRILIFVVSMHQAEKSGGGGGVNRKKKEKNVKIITRRQV